MTALPVLDMAQCVLDALPDIVFVKDRSRVYRQINRAGVDFFGRPATDIVGALEDDLFPLDVAASIAETDRIVIEEGQSVTRVERWRRADGQERVLEISKRPLCDAAGAVIGLVGSARDITAHESQGSQAANYVQATLHDIADHPPPAVEPVPFSAEFNVDQFADQFVDKLVGIDIDVALKSTMGQMPFLARVLQIFVNTQSDFGARFIEARAADEQEAPGRLAHTLKGAAASIGAEPLRQAALALEQACKHAAADSVVQGALDAVLSELQPVLNGISQALRQSSS